MNFSFKISPSCSWLQDHDSFDVLSRFSLSKNANIDDEKVKALIFQFAGFYLYEINHSDHLILFHHSIFIINVKFVILILNLNKCRLCKSGWRNISFSFSLSA